MAPIESEQSSLLHIERISQYVSLPPACLATPLESVYANVFSPMLLSYYSLAGGIILAYQNVQLSDEPPRGRPRMLERARKRRRHQEDGEDEEDEELKPEGGGELLLQIVNEYSAAFLWATADLLVLRPEKDAWVEGRITHQSSTHITLSYLNAFPISILKSQLPTDWTYHSSSSHHNGAYTRGNNEVAAADGYWCNEDDVPVEETLRVRIRDFDLRSGMKKGKGLVSIEGTLLSMEEEKSAEERANAKQGKSKTHKGAGRRVEQSGEMIEDD